MFFVMYFDLNTLIELDRFFEYIGILPVEDLLENITEDIWQDGL